MRVYVQTFLVGLLSTLALVNSAEARPPVLNSKTNSDAGNFFFSEAGREHEVSFKALFQTEFTTVEEIEKLTTKTRQNLVQREILPLMDYLFGPLVNRSQGSPQRIKEVVVDWDSAVLVNGKVVLPYVYRGVWIVSSFVSEKGTFLLPVPFNRQIVFSPKWKSCTDRALDHQTTGFFWYFWDPERFGCDQTEGRQFQTVTVDLGRMTPNLEKTYPEYKRMLEDQAMTMTLAFGYATDPAVFNPASDSDVGVYEYRDFLRQFRNGWGTVLKEEPILQSEYKGASTPNLVIGQRFSGDLHGSKVVVNIVVAAGIDQMELFAKSFAHDHDDLFAWFGHSRVGSGFDAERFGNMVKWNPSYYSISNAYQIIYWGGCNSYSYYTLPFFEFKGGSLNLDIVANGLPSYFSLNADNALITAQTFLNWPTATSYQSFVRAVEQKASRMGIEVLVGVLGDEDNAQ